MHNLVNTIHKCTVCSSTLVHGVNPVVQLNPDSKIVIIGQAPGKRVHETGIPWNDRSGDTLRQWLNVNKEEFYDAKNISIMGMGFCYPGKGTSGDLPPQPECAKLWHPKIMSHFRQKPLIILIGQYAQKHYLKKSSKINLTENVRSFEEFLPDYFVLPHPFPRNQNWVKLNPWFTEEVIPQLQLIVRQSLQL